MPSDNRNSDTDSGPENPIAASVHGTNATAPSLLFVIKRFFRRLFITVCLLGIVVIPLLLYFTDIAPPVRYKMQELVARHSLYRQSEKALAEARLKIASLEQELAAAKFEPVPPPPPTQTTPKSVKIIPEEKPLDRIRKNEKVSTLRNGVTVRKYIDIRKENTASATRNHKEAYELETRLKISHPVANQSISELSALNPELPKMLPGLKSLLKNSKVSPLFDKIYGLKIERVISEMGSPTDMETRHNFFDCESILALSHPKTKTRVLLMQGEMDVVADGTDGDRWPYLNESIAKSRYFQHATSYRWKKTSDKPNPLLARAQSDLKKVLARYAVKGLSSSENARLRARRDELRRQIREMQSTSFLIGEVDPFIVLPLSFLNQKQLSHAPAIGDFAVVIYQEKLYPAICGDVGPSWKLGEGSYFLARALNPKSNTNYRPVSDLKVTYLVFPGTRPETSVAPDLIDWRKRCESLLEGIGGMGKGYQLHNWRDIPAERKALKELKQLTKAFGPVIKKRESSVTDAKKALTEAEDKVDELRQKIVDLEKPEKTEESTEAEEGDEEAEPLTEEQIEAAEKEAEAIRLEWRTAEEQKIVLENGLIKAQEAVTLAEEQEKLTLAAIKEAEAVIELPESTPRELSTDIVLTALTDGKAAIEMLNSE